MPHYLLLSRSVTHAQQMSAILNRSGIRTGYGRAPMALAKRGCGYALRLRPALYAGAAAILSKEGYRPQSVYFDPGDGIYREITGSDPLPYH